MMPVLRPRAQRQRRRRSRHPQAARKHAATATGLVFLYYVAAVNAQWCPNFCAGHGICGDDEVCQCFDDWTSYDCSERVCPYGLSWVLSDAAEREAASTPSFPLGLRAYVECSAKGECNRKTGICECFEGFSGSGCRRSNCPNNCSGNGVCILEADVAGYYGRTGRLQAQKQYWNGRMARRCMCDSHFWGNDCSQRICPQGVDPEVETCEHIKRAKDVQTITVSLANDLALMDPSQIDQYFALTFTDVFDARVTTRPISFWEDAGSVQQALLALPNFAIMDVEVVKFFPLNDYDGTVIPDRGAAVSSTLQAAGHLREIICERLHHDLFRSPSCADDDDCVASFGLDTNRLLCDANMLQCVETDRTACAVVDGKAEFRGGARCALGFEPNGVYEDSAGDKYWGRRLGAADRACHVGNFPPGDPHFARACESDDDCVRCAAWSQVRNGVCREGRCGVSDEYRAVMGQDAADECRVASWSVKFTSARNLGTQGLFGCTFGVAETASSGASPAFLSAGLASCQVLRTGIPEWSFSADAGSASQVNNATGVVEAHLCYETDAASLRTTASFVLPETAASGDYDACFRLVSPDDMVDDIRYVTADQSAVVRAVEPVASTTDWTVLNGIFYPDDPVFTDEEVAVVEDAVYDEVLPCSNEGACTAAGTCACRDGFQGSSCEKRLMYV
jgi:hypothetical protein